MGKVSRLLTSEKGKGQAASHNKRCRRVSLNGPFSSILHVPINIIVFFPLTDVHSEEEMSKIPPVAPVFSHKWVNFTK